MQAHGGPPGVLPGPTKLKTKAAGIYKRALNDKWERQKGDGVVAAYGFACGESDRAETLRTA